MTCTCAGRWRSLLALLATRLLNGLSSAAATRRRRLSPASGRAEYVGNGSVLSVQFHVQNSLGPQVCKGHGWRAGTRGRQAGAPCAGGGRPAHELGIGLRPGRRLVEALDAVPSAIEAVKARVQSPPQQQFHARTHGWERSSAPRARRATTHSNHITDHLGTNGGLQARRAHQPHIVWRRRPRERRCARLLNGGRVPEGVSIVGRPWRRRGSPRQLLPRAPPFPAARAGAGAARTNNAAVLGGP